MAENKKPYGLSENWQSVFTNFKEGMEVSNQVAAANSALFDLSQPMSNSDWNNVTSFNISKIGTVDILKGTVITPTTLSPNIPVIPKKIIPPGPQDVPNVLAKDINPPPPRELTLKEHAEKRFETIRNDAAETKESYLTQRDEYMESRPHVSTPMNSVNERLGLVASGKKDPLSVLFKGVSTDNLYEPEEPLPVSTSNPAKRDFISTLSDSLYNLNNGEVEEGMNPGNMHYAETNLIKKLSSLVDDEALAQAAGEDIKWSDLMGWDETTGKEKLKVSPDKARKILHSVSEYTQAYNEQVRLDRMYIKDAEALLTHSSMTGTSLQEVLLGEDNSGIHTKVKDTMLAEHISKNLKPGASDEVVRGKLKNFLMTSRWHDSTEGMVTPIPFIDSAISDNYKFSSELRKSLSDSYNADSTRYPKSHNYGQVFKAFTDVRSSMQEEIQSHIIDYRDYLVASGDQPEVYRTAAVDDLYDHMKLNADVLDNNQRYYDKMQATVLEYAEEERRLPNQPIVRFQNALLEQFLKNPESVEMQRLSSAHTVELRTLAVNAKHVEDEARAGLVIAKEKEIELMKNIREKEKAYTAPFTINSEEEMRYYQLQKEELPAFKEEMKIHSDFMARNINIVRSATEDSPEDVQQIVREYQRAEKKFMPLQQKVQQLQHGKIAMLIKTNSLAALEEEAAIYEGVKGSVRSADELAAIESKEYTEYQQALSDREVHKEHTAELERRVREHGRMPGEIKVSPGSLRLIRDAIETPQKDADGKEIDLKASTLQYKGTDIDAKKQWMNAKTMGETIRMPKSQVGYKVEHIVDNTAYLKRDQIHMKNVEVSFPETDIDNIYEVIDKMERQKERESVTRAMTKEITDRAMTGKRFVQIVFNPEAVDTAIGDKYGSYLMNMLQEAESHFLSTNPIEESKVANISVANISVANMREMFENSFASIGSSTRTQNRMQMPEYLSKMLQSHASFMLDKEGKVMGTAYDALYTVIDDMAMNNSTIDITDDAIIRRWKENEFGPGSNATDAILDEDQLKQLGKFEETLKGRNVPQRIEDHIFQDVLQAAHKTYFEEVNTKNRDNILDKVVESIIERDSGTQNLSGEEMKKMLDSQKIREFFKESPHYSRVQRMGVSEMREYIAETDGVSERVFSDNNEVTRNAMLLDYEGDTSKTLADSDIIDEGEKVHGAFGREMPLEGDHLFDNDILDKMRIVENHKQIPNPDFELTNEHIPKSMRFGKVADSYFGMNQLDTMFDFFEQKGINTFEGNINLPDVGNVLSEFTRGADGDVIAYVPTMNKRFVVAPNDSAGHTVVSIGTKGPQRLYGEAEAMKDIGQGGTPKRDSFINYANVQGSGKYMVPSNPSVTVDEMMKFYGGKKVMSYMDIETTGMNPKYIPKNVVQPIEVYAQKVQWDRDAGGLQQEDGQYTIKNQKGENVIRESHQFVKLTDATKEFASEVMDNEDFKFNIGNQEFSAIDYMAEQQMVKDGSLPSGYIHQKILNDPQSSKLMDIVGEKQEKLMFLQNIAKYAFPQEDMGIEEKKAYNMYAMNTPPPSYGRLLSEGVSEADLPIAVERGQQQYLNTLFDDVAVASDNLDRAGLSGKNRFVFAEGQVGTDIGGMLKNINKFLGKTTVIGQNVARADMETLLNTVDMYKEQTLAGRTQVSEGNQKASALLREDLELLRQDLFADAKKEFGDSKMPGELVEQQPKDARGVNQHNSIDDWLRRLEDTESDGFNRVGYVSGMKSAAETIEKIKSVEQIQASVRKNGSVLPEHHEFLDDQGVQGYRDVEPLPKVPFVEEIDADGKVSMVDPVVKQANELRQEINNRPIVEQMFMSKMVNPNLGSHSSAAQMAYLGDGAEEYHLAKNDVRANLKLVDHYGKELLKDDTFAVTDTDGRFVEAAFDNTSYQAGDVVDMHKSVQDAPRGLYEIESMGDTSQKIPMILSRINEDGTKGEPLKIGAPSDIELSRKIEQNFNYVGSGEVAEVAEKYAHDNARRSILHSMDNIFEFEGHAMEAEQILSDGELTHMPLRNMAQAYESGREKMDAPPKDWRNPVPFDLADLTDEERVAQQSANIFATDSIDNLLKAEASTTQSASLMKTMEFMDSDFGRKQGQFLKDVDNLKETGVIGGKQAGNILKSWNESIKAEGMRRGAKHQLGDNIALGDRILKTDDKGNVLSKIPDMRLDIGSGSSVAESTYELANRFKSLSPGSNEGEQRAAALKNHVVPILQSKGLIPDSAFQGIESPSVNQIVREVQSSLREPGVRESLKPFEQFDPLAHKMLSEDKEFMGFMDTERERLIGSHAEAASPLQRMQMESMADTESKLRASGHYTPHLTIKPMSDAIDQMALDAIDLSSPGMINQSTTGELVRIAESLKVRNNVKDADLINSIYSNIFNRATKGRNIGGMIPEIMETRGPESSQVQAMKAMNWIQDNPDHVPGGSAPYIENPNIHEHIFGDNTGGYAARPMGEVPTSHLNDIAEQNFGKYTKDNSSNYLQHKIQDWSRPYSPGSYPNHSGVRDAPQQVMEDADGNVVSRATYNAREASAKAVQQVHADGAQAAAARAEGQAQPPVGEQEQVRVATQDQSSTPYSNPNEGVSYREQAPESTSSRPIPQREAAAIERVVADGYQSVRNKTLSAIDSLDMGAGGSGRWIAGIGVAAFALSAFSKASAPLQIQERPQGHGVAGATGQEEDDMTPKEIMNQNKSDTSGTTYANSGEKGYTIKAKGKVSSSPNQDTMQEDIKSSFGNVEINMRDDRASLDRGWLENQFSSFIDRGHVE